MSFEGAGPGARNDIARRATPIVNANFVVVQIPISPAGGPPANLNLVEEVTAAVTAVGAAITHTYPVTCKGLLVCADTVTCQGMTDKGGATTAVGINVPIGQSLYLPYEGGPAAGLEYTSAAVTSVAVFF